MIASKYPFLDVHFYKFRVKGEQIWMKLLDYGCVMAKLDLGKDKVNGRGGSHKNKFVRQKGKAIRICL
jgi:hypothetical protein